MTTGDQEGGGDDKSGKNLPNGTLQAKSSFASRPSFSFATTKLIFRIRLNSPQDEFDYLLNIAQ